MIASGANAVGGVHYPYGTTHYSHGWTISLLDIACARRCSAEIIQALIKGGADPVEEDLLI